MPPSRKQKKTFRKKNESKKKRLYKSKRTRLLSGGIGDTKTDPEIQMQLDDFTKKFEELAPLYKQYICKKDYTPELVDLHGAEPCAQNDWGYLKLPSITPEDLKKINDYNEMVKKRQAAIKKEDKESGLFVKNDSSVTTKEKPFFKIDDSKFSSDSSLTNELDPLSPKTETEKEYLDGAYKSLTRHLQRGGASYITQCNKGSIIV